MSSDSPTDRELLLEILSRLRSIEESLGIAYKSDIGNPNRSGGRREREPMSSCHGFSQRTIYRRAGTDASTTPV